jgi:TonB family protein
VPNQVVVRRGSGGSLPAAARPSRPRCRRDAAGTAAGRRLYQGAAGESRPADMQLLSHETAPATRKCCNRFRTSTHSLPSRGMKVAIQYRGVFRLSESRKVYVNRAWPAILLLFTATICFAADSPARRINTARMVQRERQFWRTVVRTFQVVDVRHISSSPSCESVQPPEALTTPGPLFTSSTSGRKVKVSFIIGIDGRVHSPLILESAGIAGDRRVLQTVRTWRYRPATCNGVPTETEGKVEFSKQ